MKKNVVGQEAFFCLQQKIADLSVKMNNEHQNSSYIIYPFNASKGSCLYISHSSHPDSLKRKEFLTSDFGNLAGILRFDSKYIADYKVHMLFLFNINPYE